MIDECYVEFFAKDSESLHRTVELFHILKSMAELDEVDYALFTTELSESEKAFFWNPSPEEVQEWEEEWFSTPVEVRLSSEMVTPPWHLESMLDAFWNGDYDLLEIREHTGKYYLTYDPHGFPYGGTGCMVAFLECIGHQVIGIDDGTGYSKYSPRTKFWRSKAQQ